MKKYLSIATGNTPAEARALFVSDDQDLVDLVMACLVARLEADDAPAPAPALERRLASALPN